MSILLDGNRKWGASMDLVIVSGMSGAGKTVAINALEDAGYYCVDNVPPRLLGKFAELPAQSDGKISRIALVVDVRSKDMFTEYFACLDGLEAANYRFKTLFLECDDKTLMIRYKETRRRHPLMSDEMASVEDAISLEREMLEAVKDRSDYVIDTSLSSPAQVKNRIRDMFSGGLITSMVVHCTSFGFKYGLPSDADLVFDVRCLPNPYYDPSLRELTGLEQPVRDFVLKFPQAVGLLPKLLDLLDYLIPLYNQEGKSQLVVAVGCTGGKHRSVVFAQQLAAHLTRCGVAVTVSHRDIGQSARK